MTQVLNRNVLVMMPFGGGVSDNVSLYGLRYYKIKHIVENEIDINSHNLPVKYKVNYLKSNVETFDALLDKVTHTHIVVIFVSGYNSNVIYEMAIRSALRGWMLLIVDNESDLPDYCKSELYLKWASSVDIDAEKQLGEFQIDMAGIEDDPTSQNPEIRKIFSRDTVLKKQLEGAFQEIELGKSRKPILRELTKYILPGEIIDNWSPPLPLSIIRFTWNGMTAGRYEENNKILGPIVHAANDHFLRMFNFTEIHNPFDANCLETSDLVDRLMKDQIVDKRILSAFLAEQKDLMKKVFYYGSCINGKIPLQFNENSSAYPNKAFLPTLIGTNTIGTAEGTHDKYYAILYIPASTKQGESPEI